MCFCFVVVVVVCFIFKSLDFWLHEYVMYRCYASVLMYKVTGKSRTILLKKALCSLIKRSTWEWNALDKLVGLWFYILAVSNADLDRQWDR